MATELFTAIKSGDRSAVDELLDRDPRLLSARDDSGLSPILAALYRGQREIASTILRRKPKLNVYEAAAAGDADRVRELVDGEPRLAGTDSADGYSALGLAAFFKHRDVVKYLLVRGADVHAASRQGRFTPLHSAVATDAAECDVELVRALLDAGADPNAKSASGGTPLHTTAFTGDRESAELLLRYGADRTIKNGQRKTPADVARERGNDEVARLLAATG
jgi:ankyrin repeat protein